jgi:hypothetical protein
MNWNGPAKGRERLGFSDFVDVHTKGGDEEISLEVGVGEVAARRWGRGAVGRGSGRRRGFLEGDVVGDGAVAAVGQERAALVV